MAPFLELHPARSKGAGLSIFDSQGQSFSRHLPLRELIVLILLWRARCCDSSPSIWRGNLSKWELHELYLDVSGGSAGIGNMTDYVAAINAKVRGLMVEAGWATVEESKNLAFITTGRGGYGLGFDELDLCDKLADVGTATNEQLRAILELQEHRTSSSE